MYFTSPRVKENNEREGSVPREFMEDKCLGIWRRELILLKGLQGYSRTSHSGCFSVCVNYEWCRRELREMQVLKTCPKIF